MKQDAAAAKDISLSSERGRFFMPFFERRLLPCTLQKGGYVYMSA